jgi:putative intracellular protease/amidase
MVDSPSGKGKIGVLIEDHYDPTEFEKFNEYFPQQGYDVEYLTHLWGNPSVTYWANPEEGVIKNQVKVTVEVNSVKPSDYKALIFIGAYAMDRLRYQEHVTKGQVNRAPAVNFLRAALNTKGLKLGTICHSLWLFCADPSLIKGRKVTCAHNIICDVENAGGVVLYDEQTKQVQEIVIDGDLISAWHPKITDEFMATMVQEIEKGS